MTTEKLSGNGAEHDEHEEEEDHDVEHDGQGVEDSGHQTRHIGDLVDSSQRSQDSDDLDCGDIASFEEQTYPAKDHDHEIEL